MKRLLMLKSMMKRITIAIVSSPQHFCFIAAIEYPKNIMDTDISNAGLHHVKISILIPNHSLSIFTLNHKYSISIETTVAKGMNNQYNLRWVLISIRFILKNFIIHVSSSWRNLQPHLRHHIQQLPQQPIRDQEESFLPLFQHW